MSICGLEWKSRPLILFGAGAVGQRLLREQALRVAFFVDNHRHGAWIGNIPVYAPEQLRSRPEGALIVIATTLYYPELARQLENMGFAEGTDFVGYFRLFPQEFTGIRQISYLVNQRCNSRCKMCDIWKQQQTAQLSPDELRQLLSNPRLALTDTFLLTGGEPSLCPNLPEYAAAAAETLPNLKFFSINVNGLLPERTLAMARQMNLYLSGLGIHFFVGVSIDGLGTVHDAIRGVDGAFDRAYELLCRLREAGIDTQVSATVMKDNLWHMDEFLSFMRLQGFEAMFKLVRSSHTLNGGRLSDAVQDYTEDDLYQLKLFYHKVEALSREAAYTKGFSVYYQGIKAFLEQGRRVMGCSFANGTAIHIKNDGSSYICANSPAPVELDGPLTERLRQRHGADYEFTSRALCGSCISDCMAADTGQLAQLRDTEAFWQKFYSLDYYESHLAPVLEELNHPPRQPVVLITGWYGTETVGDKAILGELLHQYASERPDCRILVTSLYPFITRRTLRELGSDAEVIPLYSWSCLKTAAAARIVCVGGGPLMELELLAVPLWLFSAARANGGQTVLHGCGIGPLLSAKRTDAVRKILALSDRILLRDRAGVAWARELSGRDDVACVGDPAERYLRRTYPKSQRDDKRPVLACFLREPTEEYRGTMTCEEFRLFRESFETGLAENIKALARREQLDIRFYSMHNFCVGGDDRDFAFRFAQKHFEPGSCWIDNQLTGIEPVVQAMNRARICLCMRFHSVLFADTLEAEYLAIDYTGGGKIHGYLKDHDQLRRLVGMRDLLRGENVLLDAAREAGICKP